MTQKKEDHDLLWDCFTNWADTLEKIVDEALTVAKPIGAKILLLYVSPDREP